MQIEEKIGKQIEAYRRNGNSISDLLHNRTSRAESRGCDIVADVIVDDNGGHDVQDDFKDLKHTQGLGEVLRSFHLRDETEESHMGTWANVNTIQPLPPKKRFIALLTVREDDVGHSTKRVVKVGLLGDVDITAFELDTDGDHGNHYRRKDTDKGYFCSLGPSFRREP